MTTFIQRKKWEEIPLESIEQEIRDAYSAEYSISIEDKENEINISIDFEDWCDKGKASSYIKTDNSFFNRTERTIEEVLECIQ